MKYIAYYDAEGSKGRAVTVEVNEEQYMAVKQDIQEKIRKELVEEMEKPFNIFRLRYWELKIIYKFFIESF